jgi:ABC-type Co2+ transport system permease subunit
MLEPKYERRQAAVKEAYVGLVGWAWIAASIAAVYYLFRAIFFGGSWWTFVGTSVVAWVLYRVALYYQLENERRE